MCLYDSYTPQWCYVGKRNLEEAVTTSGVPIELHWEPYFLDASTPKEGRDLQEYLMAKYGRAAIERFQSANNPLDKAGVRVGIQFNKERRVINTLDGHRAMEWCKAQSPDSADGLMEKLFYAYFVEAKNLCDQDVLVDVCVSAGLDGDAVRAMLLTGIS